MFWLWDLNDTFIYKVRQHKPEEESQVTNQKLEWTTVPNFLKEHKGLVAKNLIYTAISKGNIPSIRVGRKILIPANCLEQLLRIKHP